MVSIQVLATPMIGFARSSSVNPMAFSIARAGARSRPCVMVWLCNFMASFQCNAGRGDEKSGPFAPLYLGTKDRNGSIASTSLIAEEKAEVIKGKGRWATPVFAASVALLLMLAYANHF